MKKTPLRITALLLIACLILCGCGESAPAGQEKEKETEAGALPAESGETGTETVQNPPKTEEKPDPKDDTEIEPATEISADAGTEAPGEAESSPETEPNPAGEDGAEPTPAMEENPADSPVVTEDPAPEQTAFSPAGSWRCYLPSSRQEVLWLELRADGSFSVTVDEDSILWAWERETPFFTYAGRWSTAEDGSFTLLPEETNDPAFSGWLSLGDYRFTRLTDCDGDELAELRQLNNGEGLYTRFFLGEKPWLFCRETENRDAAEPQRNAVFTARVWKIAYEPSFRLWTESVTVDDDGLIREGSGQCAVYEVKSTESTSLLSGGPEGLLALGNTVYRFETDAEGRIVTADSVYTGPAPTEEEALYYLSRCEEAREYMDAGLSVLCEGSGRILDGMFVTFLTLGTDREEQFVREIRYAVNPEGWVLRYDPVFDEWSWVG